MALILWNNHSLLVFQQCFEREAVGVEPETAYHAQAGARYERVVAELLALVNVGDVYLHRRAAQRAEAVLQSHAGVGVGSCVEYHAVESEAHLLQLVDKLALDVALVVVYLHVGIGRAQRLEVAFKRVAAVDARLAHAEKIKVWSVDYLYLHVCCMVKWMEKHVPQSAHGHPRTPTVRQNYVKSSL